MEFNLKRYKKDFEHSYTFGVFPTLELLQHRPAAALKVLTHPKGKGNQGIAKIRALCRENGIPHEIQEKSITRLGGRENDYAVGIFRKFEAGLAANTNHVVLVNPEGMGNLGTIIRTMLGFDFRDLAVILPAADMFHPDVVRAAMGALFQLRFECFDDFEIYREKFPRNFYPLMTDGAISLPEASFTPAFGLVFGPESAGLPDEFHTIDAGSASISIPQNSTIDSLNLAVSVGITLYHAVTSNIIQTTKNRR